MSNNTQISANDRVVVVEGTLSSLQIASVMFFWPFHIHHSNSCEECLFTPISPAFNSRDICDSRLRDDVNIDLIRNTVCHVIVGKRVSSSAVLYVEAVHNRNYFPMYSVFDRYKSERESSIHDYFDCKFSNTEIIRDTAQLIKKLCSQRNPSLAVRSNVDKLLQRVKNPCSAISVLHHAMNSLYSDFSTDSDYKDLCNDLQTLQRDKLPLCLTNGSVQLQATALFQRAFPYCLSFFDGNHRHSRFVTHVLNCSRRSSNYLITEDDEDGYIINKDDGNNKTERFNCLLQYRFYHVDPQCYSFHISIEKMQQISINENEKLQSTVTEEKTHR
jgi:hypothetical protein